MWVDPKDSQRLINGNDGGATISYDGGATWSSIYNQPTAQFYHVTTDNQWPVPHTRRAAGQHARCRSRAARTTAQIGERDYYSVAGCENATIAVDPRDPNVTYGGCYTGYPEPSGSDEPAGARHLAVDGELRRPGRRARRAVPLPVDVPGAHLAARSEHAVRGVAVRAPLDGRGRELDEDLAGSHRARPGDVRPIGRPDSRRHDGHRVVRDDLRVRRVADDEGAAVGGQRRWA